MGKIYEEENYNNFYKSTDFYIPNSLMLYDNLAYDKGLYKTPDLESYKKDVEWIKGKVE